MKITKTIITVRELAHQYANNHEDGVSGFDGKLDIRPPYQREFVYKDKQRDAVINTVLKGFPLNIMYWAVTGEDTYEVLDGQQRTISICDYVNGDFSFNNRLFSNLQHDEKDRILEYALDVYVCDGSDSEKLEWFKTINIAGEELTDQEIRNAVYSGPFVSDAKRRFSARNCPAEQLYGAYLKGSAIRQDYFETAMEWLNNGHVEGYMSQHQQDNTSLELWNYFQNVFEWVKAVFPHYRKEMKGIDWGYLYNDFYTQTAKINPNTLENNIRELMIDDEITNKKGIYTYVLSGNERTLNLRAFTPKQKREMYEMQDGICVVCKKQFTLSEMDADHITPWSQGGQTEIDNGQMLCKEDNRRKSNR